MTRSGLDKCQPLKQSIADKTEAAIQPEHQNIVSFKRPILPGCSYAALPYGMIPCALSMLNNAREDEENVSVLRK
jgi:hypothetical protein